MSLYPELPRELIDTIITCLISLYDDDPAYQWTRLRLITRHHKTLIEQHFHDFWVPKLSFAACLDNSYLDEYVCFKPYKEKIEALAIRDENGLPIFVAFEASHEADELIMSLGGREEMWIRKVISPEHSPPYEGNGSKEILVRLGEGTLNKGFTKGGIVSDVVIPDAHIFTGSDPWQLRVKWRKLFSWLFREEMLLRNFRDKILENFWPTIEEMKSVEERNEAIYMFLRTQYEAQSKLMLDAFRRHLAWESQARHRAQSQVQQSLDPHMDSFDMTPFLNQPPMKVSQLEYRAIDDTLAVTGDEQSIVFRIPGWETWSIRQLARLRIMDECIVDNEMLPGESMGYAGELYYKDMRVREDEMKGEKEASEETLEMYLRGPSLNPKLFWEW